MAVLYQPVVSHQLLVLFRIDRIVHLVVVVVVNRKEITLAVLLDGLVVDESSVILGIIPIRTMIMVLDLEEIIMRDLRGDPLVEILKQTVTRIKKDILVGVITDATVITDGGFLMKVKKRNLNGFLVVLYLKPTL